MKKNYPSSLLGDRADAHMIACFREAPELPQNRILFPQLPAVRLAYLKDVPKSLARNLARMGIVYLHELLPFRADPVQKMALAEATGASAEEIGLLFQLAMRIHRNLAAVCANLEGVRMILQDDGDADAVQTPRPRGLPPFGAAQVLAAAVLHCLAEDTQDMGLRGVIPLANARPYQMM